jgi:hypothetical protein
MVEPHRCAHSASARRNRAPRPHASLADACREASAGLMRRDVNHNGIPTAAGGQRPATQDLLLKHSDEPFATYA